MNRTFRKNSAPNLITPTLHLVRYITFLKHGPCSDSPDYRFDGKSIQDLVRVIACKHTYAIKTFAVFEGVSRFKGKKVRINSKPFDEKTMIINAEIVEVDILQFLLENLDLNIDPELVVDITADLTPNDRKIAMARCRTNELIPFTPKNGDCIIVLDI
jgi:hypothetical protein